MASGSRKRSNSRKEMQKEKKETQREKKESQKEKKETQREKQKEIAKHQGMDKDKGQSRKSIPIANTSVPNKAEKLIPWTPGSYIALKALLSARLCSAIWGIINDCDETYNYWEPTHYLLYGKGFQTWEYSPEFALRSYTYLMLHAGPAYIYAQLLQSNRMLVFFFIRCFLALVASGCELYFYRGVCKEFGANIGRITLGITVFSAGMFIASTAYLPSSFAMYMAMLSLGAWFHNSLELSIFTTALSTFLGWPFAALIGAPIAYDIVIRKRKYKMFFKWCLISAFTILMPMIQLDSQYFGRLVIAPLNLVLYNVFTSHGPDLYGTSPPSFYFYNGFLNFNISFIASLVALPLYVVFALFAIVPFRRSSRLPIWLSLLSFHLWLIVFLLQPHKEERFLFPIYPLICLSAALAVDTLQKAFFAIVIKDKKSHYLNYTNWISIIFVIVTSVFSISRIFGQYQAYRAPFDTFLELNRLEQEGSVPNLRFINVCYGREWHRYPSSFFLPGMNWNIKFLESEFRGQLPQPFFSEKNGSEVTPLHMNDRNQEERSRYISPTACHFLIDVDREEVTEREPRYSQQTNLWKVVHSVPFLDVPKSPQLLRAFYIPYFTEKYCSYINYNLLQSTKLTQKVHPG